MAQRGTDPESGLTPQQEVFAAELAKTGNQSEAYRKAYPKSKMNPNAMAVEACRLAAQPNISLRLSQLRSDLRAESGITLRAHLDTLEELRDAARGAKQFAAAITAEINRGKVSGLYEGTGDEGDAPPVAQVQINITDARKG